MKIIALFLLTVFLGKSCDNVAQNDIKKATIQYTATTRGFYKKIIINNNKAFISIDRNEKEIPTEITISAEDWKELVGYFQKINLEELPNLKDPTQKRFYDGAAIANLIIRYQDKDYKTTDFDHEFPPAEIEKLVNKIVELTKAKE
jgi:hypothetical protein